MPFLRTEWRKLVLANYAIEKEILLPYVPAQTVLDTWQDTCFVSLVGFMFVNTQFWGFPIPFHTDFEEVNLRFYVRFRDGGKWKRGVAFIREIVPKPAIAYVANKFYHEHYVTMPMRHNWSESKLSQQVEYSWKCSGEWQSVSVTAKALSQAIPDESEAEYITEHFFGYTQAGPDQTFEYEVAHPRWEIYPLLDYDIRVDFDKVYGKPFGILNELTPRSVLLAEGSHVTVGGKRQI